MYIWQQPQWPNWQIDMGTLATPLASVRHGQGRLLGRMEAMGFKLRDEAWLQTLTQDVIKTSEIEGEHLDKDLVRSSIARRLGIDISALAPADRIVEGIVDVMLTFLEWSLQPSNDGCTLGIGRFPLRNSGDLSFSSGSACSATRTQHGFDAGHPRAGRRVAGGQPFAERRRPVAAELGHEPPQRGGQRATEAHRDSPLVGLELTVAPDHVGQHVAEQQSAEEHPGDGREHGRHRAAEGRDGRGVAGVAGGGRRGDVLEEEPHPGEHQHRNAELHRRHHEGGRHGELCRRFRGCSNCLHGIGIN